MDPGPSMVVPSVIHPLLGPQLVGKQFRVVADHGNVKQEIVIVFTLVSGQLSI